VNFSKRGLFALGNLEEANRTFSHFPFDIYVSLYTRLIIVESKTGRKEDIYRSLSQTAY